MNNADKNINKKLISKQKNKLKKSGRNGKTIAPKFRSINEAFYNDLIEQCIINGTSISGIEKTPENPKQRK